MTLGDDIIGHGQTQPGTFARRLGCKKGLEYFVDNFNHVFFMLDSDRLSGIKGKSNKTFRKFAGAVKFLDFWLL